MRYRVGDAVRLKAGSLYRELLGDERSDLTATVQAVDEEGERIALAYPEPFPGWTSALPAAEFVPDTPPAAAPASASSSRSGRCDPGSRDLGEVDRGTSRG